MPLPVPELFFLLSINVEFKQRSTYSKLMTTLQVMQPGGA
jgi:hypothetical protein